MEGVSERNTRVFRSSILKREKEELRETERAYKSLDVFIFNRR
jgi:hypothetical protein